MKENYIVKVENKRQNEKKTSYLVDITCKCGNKKTVYLQHITSGRTQSCGCRKVTHGVSNTRMYRIWRGMKTRCCNNKSDKYKYYGGRGISLCPRWTIFKNFCEDMNKGYSDHLTLDRIDVNGEYCKENCRWVTHRKQQHNRRNNIKWKGKCQVEWSKILGGSCNLVQVRVKRLGWSMKKACTTPLKVKNASV